MDNHTKQFNIFYNVFTTLYYTDRTSFALTAMKIRPKVLNIVSVLQEFNSFEFTFGFPKHRRNNQKKAYILPVCYTTDKQKNDF